MTTRRRMRTVRTVLNWRRWKATVSSTPILPIRPAPTSPRRSRVLPTTSPRDPLLAVLRAHRRNACMASITIRNVPDDVRDELAARARLSGRCRQEYLCSELAEFARCPDLDVLIAEARRRTGRTGSQRSRRRVGCRPLPRTSPRRSLPHADLLALRVELLPYAPLADRCWQLRANVTTDDAASVALAERLHATLATLDLQAPRVHGAGSSSQTRSAAHHPSAGWDTALHGPHRPSCRPAPGHRAASSPAANGGAPTTKHRMPAGVARIDAPGRCADGTRARPWRLSADPRASSPVGASDAVGSGRTARRTLRPAASSSRHRSRHGRCSGNDGRRGARPRCRGPTNG